MGARLALSVAAGAASVFPSFLVGALALQIHDDLDAGVETVAAGVTVFFLAGALAAGWGGRLREDFGFVGSPIEVSVDPEWRSSATGRESVRASLTPTMD